MLGTYGAVVTKILLMDLYRKITEAFVMDLNDTVIKTCLMSWGANSLDQLLEKAMNTEKKLLINGKTSVKWIDEMNKHSYSPQIRKFSNSHLCVGAMNSSHVFMKKI